jgi:Fe-S cluster assembly protein SufD
MPLAQALAESRPAALASFGSLSEDEAFADFNSALWGDGLYLELASGVTLAQPLYLRQAAGPPLRHLLVLGRNSQATLIQHAAPGAAATYFANSMNECVLDAAARLTHIELQEPGPQAQLIARSAARLGADSRYTHLALSTGGALLRNDLTLRLDGPGATCQLHGLSLGRGRSHIDQRVFVEHASGGGTSRQLYKSVLWERARAVFNGRVRVAPGATKTDARQVTRNLLLSRDAEADSRPQLEIFADDVKCSHGAATGSLDETQLFYLRSRGLDQATARRLLVHAFAAQVLDPLDATLRAPLDAWLHDQLEPRHAA